MQINSIQAVIFDMDGLLVDTEPLWRKAMVNQFCKAGISFTEQDCRLTTGMRFLEVVRYWNQRRPFLHMTVQQVYDAVIENLCELIAKSEVEMPGAFDAINCCKINGISIGLATSSASAIVSTVLRKIGAEKYFQSVISAEHLPFGKPHPQVFLDCAESLRVNPQNCLVLEDSVNGVIAAKAAFMSVIAIPDQHNFNDQRFSIADYKINNLGDFPSLLNQISGEVSAAT